MLLTRLSPVRTTERPGLLYSVHGCAVLHVANSDDMPHCRYSLFCQVTSLFCQVTGSCAAPKPAWLACPAASASASSLRSCAARSRSAGASCVACDVSRLGSALLCLAIHAAFACARKAAATDVVDAACNSCAACTASGTPPGAWRIGARGAASTPPVGSACFATHSAFFLARTAAATDIGAGGSCGTSRGLD